MQCWLGCVGVVVASIDTDEYTPTCPKEQWAYLGRGVMVDTDKAGLIHYQEPDADMALIKRGGGQAQQGVQGSTSPPSAGPRP